MPKKIPAATFPVVDAYVSSLSASQVASGQAPEAPAPFDPSLSDFAEVPRGAAYPITGPDRRDLPTFKVRFFRDGRKYGAAWAVSDSFDPEGLSDVLQRLADEVGTIVQVSVTGNRRPWFGARVDLDAWFDTIPRRTWPPKAE